MMILTIPIYGFTTFAMSVQAGYLKKAAFQMKPGMFPELHLLQVTKTGIRSSDTSTCVTLSQLINGASGNGKKKCLCSLMSLGMCRPCRL